MVELLSCCFVKSNEVPSAASHQFVNRAVSQQVRDVYKCPSGNLALITTDRQSAFDRVLAAIPFKGMVLNQLAAWWFSKTTDIVANGALSQPHPTVTMALPIDVFPIEFVVRGYVTGSTDTAIWTHYKAGSRNYCGHALPDGLVKNDKLAENLCTPSTKAEHGDVPISAADIVKDGHMKKASLLLDDVFAVSCCLERVGLSGRRISISSRTRP